MSSSRRARRTARQIRIRKLRVAGVVLAAAAIAAGVGYEAVSTSSTAASVLELPRGDRRLPREHDGLLGEAGGAVPAGTTVFDDRIAGVARLDDDLLAAQRGKKIATTFSDRATGWTDELISRVLATGTTGSSGASYAV